MFIIYEQNPFLGSLRLKAKQNKKKKEILLVIFPRVDGVF